jgi:hypothetical protein
LVQMGGIAVPSILDRVQHGPPEVRSQARAMLERIPGPVAVFARYRLEWSAAREREIRRSRTRF